MNEMPKSDPALDATLEKARAGEQGKNPKEFSIGGFVDTLDEDLNNKTATEKSAAELKEQKIQEELKPLVDKLNELDKISQDSGDFDEGRLEYLAIRGDEQGYKTLLSKRFADMVERAGLRDELISAYESKGGVVKLDRGSGGGNVYNLNSVFPNLENLGNVSKANMEHLLKNSPNFSVERAFNASQERTTEREISPESFLRHKKNPRALEGFGISALEAGDGSVAGKTFAKLESLGSLGPEIGKKIQGMLEGFTTEQKKAFVEAYKRGKEKAVAEKMK